MPRMRADGLELVCAEAETGRATGDFLWVSLLGYVLHITLAFQVAVEATD